MSNDYLWDRRGPPDAEIASLEELLGGLRTTASPPAWQQPRRRRSVLLAAAAALTIACGATLWLARGQTSAAGWSVARVSGRPEIAGMAVGSTARLTQGEWLQTDRLAAASLAVADIGRLEVEPDTRLRLVATGAGRHRIEMQHGTLHALIWAPPGQFVVDTPGSTAVDLGCAYTLHVDASGAGTIDVETGWVGFTFRGREAFIPAGARCMTRPGIGPGTPFYRGMDGAAQRALETLDFGADAATAKREALDLLLRSARRTDAVTLWHLLSRVPPDDCDFVFDALARLVPPPPGVTRTGIRGGDRSMRDRWWDALDLGTTSWWRVWERTWR